MEKKQFMVFRLDDTVIVTFLAVCVVASLAFVIRYQSYKPCTDFSITTLGTNFTTGSIIRFETNVKGYKRLHWDFGDNQKNVTEVASSIHAYDQSGEYLITLIVDGKCTEYKTITVNQAPEIIDSTLIARVVMPATATVGSPVIFRDTSLRATTWEWRFGETAVVDAATRSAAYTYNTPGMKTISLVINGNIKTPFVKNIFVNPKLPPKTETPVVIQRGGRLPTEPTTPPIGNQGIEEPKVTPEPVVPVIVKTPEVSVADFNQMIRGAIGGGRPIGNFTTYFCDQNPNTTTILNGRAITFRQFYDKIIKLKRSDKLTTLNTTLKKNAQTNCIVSIEVIAKTKTGILGWSNRDL